MGRVEGWVELSGLHVGRVEGWVELSGPQQGRVEGWVELSGPQQGRVEGWVELSGLKRGRVEGWVELSGLHVGRVDQAWCSGLSSAPGLLRRSVLSGYQRACWDELPSALLLGQPFFCHQRFSCLLAIKSLKPHIGRQMLPGYDACMYICPWRVRGNT